MTPKTARTIGIILISAAIFGWMIALTGIITVWAVRPGLTETAVTQVDGLKATLKITSTGLEVTDKSLGAIITSLGALETTVETTAGTINATAPFMDSLIAVTDTNLPETVANLQTSLDTAQEGAQVIDNALGVVTRIPILSSFLGGDAYDPATPLSDGLAKVSGGLDNMANTFENMTNSLQNTRDSITAVQAGINEMAASIGEITANLEDAQQVMREYQKFAENMLGFLERWGDRLPEIIAGLAIGLTVLLLWVAATQLGLFLYGMELARRREEH